MFTPRKNNDSWQEALKLVSRCPICSEVYGTNQAKVFAKNEAASLVHVTCNKCQSNFVAMILVVGQGLSSVGMITDLSFDDAVRLHKTPAISTDEAIEAHEFVQHNNFINSFI